LKLASKPHCVQDIGRNDLSRQRRNLRAKAVLTPEGQKLNLSVRIMGNHAADTPAANLPSA